ncbi:transposase [Chryseobacterium formosense]|uniref:Transposase n=1 Tax=Chryseobacterium formosense TaxID=236814 RepID=A0A085YYD0_9FLAO|nr:transposase [Chryseobacterium formosense]KFE97193.1 transposase [Chryseobacterium formosense]SFT76558.1 hypothetical protein SAMN05421857_3171 [Chryseobacterium formosense]
MDKKIQKLDMQPYYKKIYCDIVLKKYPEKEEICRPLLDKKELTVLDILKLNNIIFGDSNKENLSFNQKHRFYNKQAIFEILDYMRKNNLNNNQLAHHFKISRNTISKWKRLYY